MKKNRLLFLLFSFTFISLTAQNNETKLSHGLIARAKRALTPSFIKELSTTGKASRELFEYREFLKQGHEKDFLTIGSMGHSSSIALGIALEKKERNVYCLDGDGALLMHMGSIAIIGQKSPENFKHILLNNGCHESVGKQPTAGFNIDFVEIAKACGYKTLLKSENFSDLKEKLNVLKNSKCPGFLEIKLNKDSRKDLGRPTKTPIENKEDFIGFLKD